MGEGPPVILFIEDDDAQRAAIARALAREGYGVLEASDVDAATMLLRERPDVSLILADLVVPGRERRGVIEQLRRDAGGIPKLVISGYPLIDAQRLFGIPDAAEFLPKPFGLCELLEKVRAMIGSTGVAR